MGTIRTDWCCKILNYCCEVAEDFSILYSDILPERLSFRLSIASGVRREVHVKRGWLPHPGKSWWATQLLFLHRMRCGLQLNESTAQAQPYALRPCLICKFSRRLSTGATVWADRELNTFCMVTGLALGTQHNDVDLHRCTDNSFYWTEHYCLSELQFGRQFRCWWQSLFHYKHCNGSKNMIIVQVAKLNLYLFEKKHNHTKITSPLPKQLQHLLLPRVAQS